MISLDENYDMGFDLKYSKRYEILKNFEYLRGQTMVYSKDWLLEEMKRD